MPPRVVIITQESEEDQQQQATLPEIKMRKAGEPATEGPVKQNPRAVMRPLNASKGMTDKLEEKAAKMRNALEEGARSSPPPSPVFSPQADKPNAVAVRLPFGLEGLDHVLLVLLTGGITYLGWRLARHLLADPSPVALVDSIPEATTIAVPAQFAKFAQQ